MTLAIAIYAAILSTLSFALAAVSYRNGGPILDVSWQYDQSRHELTVFVANTGRSDITIDSVDLTLERTTISRKGRLGAAHVDVSILSRIALAQWAKLVDTDGLPLRISSNSRATWQVASEVVSSMPWAHSMDELSLRFEVESPRRTAHVWFRGELLEDFLAATRPDAP
ncbi:hypothetical protein [Micromonospora trifolii]|uniref:hypothetical protein n=1 Tax=Micromonospora trifolii TaxID=2911208 RepID=UPI003CEC56B2